MSVNRAVSGRFPLRPGRPLVFRCRRRGAWGFFCNCLHFAPNRALSSEEPNRDDWADAMRAAINHVRYWHKTPGQLETEHLERLFAADAWAGRAA